jgi:hypothetical protein
MSQTNPVPMRRVERLLAWLQRWVLPGLVSSLLLGVVLGLLLGWRVWPVRWYDTDPADLRATHQQTYVIMVADSLAINGNVELARRRLAELSSNPLIPNWQLVANRAERAAQEREGSGDQATALRVRRLAQAIPLPPPQLVPSPTPIPAAAPREAQRGASLLTLLAAVIIVAVAALAGLGLRRWHTSRQPVEGEPPFLAGSSATEPRSAVATEAPLSPSPVTEAWPPTNPASPRPREAAPSAAATNARRETVGAGATMPLPGAELPPAPTAGALERRPSSPAPEPRPTVAPASNVLVSDKLQFSQEALDFDSSHNIEAQGAFWGQCGVSAIKALFIEGKQKVYALELWMWDQEDPRRHTSTVLLSESAYRDSEVRTPLEAVGQVREANAGMSLHVETRQLRMDAVISELVYVTESDVPNSFFAQVTVQVTITRNAPPA